MVERSIIIALIIIAFGLGMLIGTYLPSIYQKAKGEPQIQCYQTIQLSKLAYHWHELILVQQNGKQLTVPAHIGFLNNKICNIHTHLTDGIIHIETFKGLPTFTLGQFLDMWNKTQSTSYHKTFDNKIVQYVFRNDVPIANYRNITLANGQQLTMVLK
jgi:hypothetical protein